MSEFLARYSMREKVIVAMALVVIIVIGTHALVIAPYQQQVTDLRDQIEVQKNDLQWMKSAIARLPRNTSGPGTVKIGGTLANYLDQAVRKQGLSGQLSQMSPIGSDEIRMRYSAVDFNRLVKFIAEVSAGGLDVKDIRITSIDNPGVVDSSLVLVRR